MITPARRASRRAADGRTKPRCGTTSKPPPASPPDAVASVEIAAGRSTELRRASLGAGFITLLVISAASPLSVVAAFELAKVVIYEASLGFLGLGVQPPTPTLGNMMGAGRSYMDQAWWLTFFPGLILVLTAAAANWVGDGLNEYFDPRGKRR